MNVDGFDDRQRKLLGPFRGKLTLAQQIPSPTRRVQLLRRLRQSPKGNLDCSANPYDGDDGIRRGACL